MYHREARGHNSPRGGPARKLAITSARKMGRTSSGRRGRRDGGVDKTKIGCGNGRLGRMHQAKDGKGRKCRGLDLVESREG